MALRVPASVVRPGLSALPRTPFPPPELKNAVLKASPGAAKLSPAEWGSLQSPPPAALSALAARLRFQPTSQQSSFPSQSTSSNTTSARPPSASDLLEQALTHPSCISLYSKYYPNAPLPSTNQNLAAVGNGLLGLFATEYVHASFPHLPTRVAKAAVSAYVGPRTLADVAKEWGASGLIRWSHQALSTKSDDLPVLHVNALASFPRALVALIAQHVSLAAAQRFVHDHLLSRAVDLAPLLKFKSPKITLTETCAKFGRERPISRLLKETGRYTNTPIFVVGIFSGVDKLGEGFGNSIKMAEYRAAEDALNRLYLTQQPAHSFTLPTSTFPSALRTSGASLSPIYTSKSAPGAGKEAGKYRAAQLGESEVLYASAGRTGRAASSVNGAE